MRTNAIVVEISRSPVPFQLRSKGRQRRHRKRLGLRRRCGSAAQRCAALAQVFHLFDAVLAGR
jgi:hypothetical protein